MALKKEWFYKESRYFLALLVFSFRLQPLHPRTTPYSRCRGCPTEGNLHFPLCRNRDAFKNFCVTKQIIFLALVFPTRTPWLSQRMLLFLLSNIGANKRWNTKFSQRNRGLLYTRYTACAAFYLWHNATAPTTPQRMKATILRTATAVKFRSTVLCRAWRGCR